jgi:hypothetical protein
MAELTGFFEQKLIPRYNSASIPAVIMLRSSLCTHFLCITNIFLIASFVNSSLEVTF